ncbi:MAG: zf-HC2 domain-containing protein [Acidobacteriota bacterium]
MADEVFVTDRVSEHLAESLIERYRRRQLDPAEMLALDEHLTACAACRGQMRVALSLADVPARLQNGLVIVEDEGDHLAGGQLRAYLQQQLDAVDRELAESHLDFCQNCQSRLGELRRAMQPENTPVAVSDPKQPDSENWFDSLLPGWLRKMLAGGGQPPLLALRVAGAMALLALLALGVWRWRAAGDNQPQVVVVPSPTATIENKLPPPAPPSTQVLAINDGDGQVTLDAQGNVAGIESLSAAQQQAIKTALANGQVDIPRTLAELKGTGGGLMGGPNPDPAEAWAASTATLLSPLAEIILENRPTLRWKPLAGADGYIVIINNPAANYSEVAASPKLTVTRWTPPGALPRGRLYTWQVTAFVKDASGNEREVTAPAPEAAEAKFRVLGQAEADEVEQGRQLYAGRHLTLGLLYTRFGLLKEAERELLALAAANPNEQIAQTLLRDLRAKRQALKSAK